MAGLTDMEELIARVKAPTYAAYLREAFVCYGAGAYRGCIVLTFIAVFEDLRAKTKQVAVTSLAAKTISNQIDALAAGQKPFETQLVNRLAAADLITQLQADRLLQIVDHRNKAAHPSGMSASAEEARFVFFESIDKFLSQPVLSTTHAADGILEELINQNYFPAPLVSEIRKIVEEEMKVVHSAAHPYLIEKLCAKIGSSDATEGRHARFFLSGLASIDAPYWRDMIYKKLIKAKAADDAFSNAVLTLLSIDPELFPVADPATALRLFHLLNKSVESDVSTLSLNHHSHPIRMATGLTSSLDDEFLFPRLSAFFDALISKYWDNPAIVNSLKGSPKAIQLLTAIYSKKAASNDYETANAMAKFLPSIDLKLGNILSNAEAFDLLVGIVRAAEGGAWSAQALSNSGFLEVKKLRKNARDHILALDDDDEEINQLDEYSYGSFLEKFLFEHTDNSEFEDLGIPN